MNFSVQVHCFAMKLAYERGNDERHTNSLRVADSLVDFLDIRGMILHGLKILRSITNKTIVTTTK